MPTPQRNQLLRALPLSDQERLFRHLKLVTLPLGAVLYESGDTQRHIYFPVDCIISLLYVLKDGASAEIAVVGNDGAVGVALFMGGMTITNRAVVASSGTAYRLSSKRIERSPAHRRGQRLRGRLPAASGEPSEQSCPCCRIEFRPATLLWRR